MIINKNKVRWYFFKLGTFLYVNTKIFFYCLINPKMFFEISFQIYSSISDFYQVCYKSLYPFEETSVFKEIKDNITLAKCNFSVDLEVMRPIETQTLATLTSYFKPKKIFEIGTYNGYSTLHFVYNSPEDSTIYTLDLPANFDLNKITNYSFDDLKVAELSKKNINNRIYAQVHSITKKVVELFGDSKIFDFSPYYGNIDLVFIDGCHDYEYVKSDTENAFKMLSKNGVIIWHDYDYVIHRDVFDYLNSLAKKEKHAIYFIKNTRLAIYGDFQ